MVLQGQKISGKCADNQKKKKKKLQRIETNELKFGTSLFFGGKFGGAFLNENWWDVSGTSGAIGF